MSTTTVTVLVCFFTNKVTKLFLFKAKYFITKILEHRLTRSTHNKLVLQICSIMLMLEMLKLVLLEIQDPPIAVLITMQLITLINVVSPNQELLTSTTMVISTFLLEMVSLNLSLLHSLLTAAHFSFCLSL